MKYMGNKRKIAKEILAVMDVKETDVFVDMFCGSLSVTQEANTKDIIANDLNKYLIAMWKGILDGEQYPQEITREFYSEVRNAYNCARGGKTYEQYLYNDGIIGWVGFMGSYNGRFYDGGYSGHNVNGRDYIGEQIRNTLGQVDMLSTKRITFSSADYEKVEFPDGAVVYCDIPYRNTKQYGNSTNFDYDRFYNWCRSVKDRCRLFVSEYSMPDDFKCIWQKEVTNAMSNKNTYRPIEKLFIL